MFTHSTKPPSKGVNHKNHTPNSSNSSRTTSGCVSTYSSALPPTSGYMLYRAKAIILTPPIPFLCFANGLSHIILHTHSNRWALGTVQEVIVAFVYVPPPPTPSPSFSKEPRPLVSCHHITACRPRGLMTGSIVHENTIIASGSIATVWMAFKKGKKGTKHMLPACTHISPKPQHIKTYRTSF